jgi:predicted RNA methylase
VEASRSDSGDTATASPPDGSITEAGTAWSLIQLALPEMNGCGKVLVAPSGTGELSLRMSRQGFTVTGVDRNEQSVAAARALAAQLPLPRPVYQMGDVESMSFADRHFDAIVCFGLFGLLPDTAAGRQIIDELCRVANRLVLLSYLSPLSLAGLRIAARTVSGRHDGSRFATPLASLRNFFAAAGFVFKRDFAHAPYRSGSHLAVFQRK